MQSSEMNPNSLAWASVCCPVLPNSLNMYLVSTDDGQQLCLALALQKSFRLLQGARSLAQWEETDVGGGDAENLAFLGQSVANATIRLNSANSERSHVPSRWQGGAGWARSGSAQTPKQLANGTITWHMRGLRGRKNDTG